MTRVGQVSFGGVIKEVSLAYLPDAGVDDYVIVHAGFALSQMDEAEAHRAFEELQKLALSRRGAPGREVPGRVPRTRSQPSGAVKAIAGLVTRPWTIMEVCGGQTHAI